MEAKWGTIYREACIAAVARELLADAWVVCVSDSRGSRVLERAMDYLRDRFEIEIEFCNLVTSLDFPSHEETSCDSVLVLR